MTNNSCGFINLSDRDQFILGQMAYDKIPDYIRDFYINVVDYLKDEFISATELARREHYGIRTVDKYLKILRDKGYVTRYNYRSWVLGNEHTEDGYVLRSDNVFGRGAMREGVRI